MVQSRVCCVWQFVVVGVIFSACTLAEDVSIEESIDGRKSTLKGIHMTLLEEESLISVIEADEAILDDNNDSFELYQVHAKIYTAAIDDDAIGVKRKPDWFHCLAPMVHYRGEENRIDISGPVFAVSQQGLVIQAVKAIYHVKQREISFYSSIVHDGHYMAIASKMAVQLDTRLYRLDQVQGLWFNRLDN